jgi:hypothetical protein
MRTQEKGDVGLRNGEAGRIDRRGERGFDQPPHEPFAEFLPLKAQRRLQTRLEKPLALRWVEPRPALHRGLEQISAPHPATFQQRGVATHKFMSYPPVWIVGILAAKNQIGRGGKIRNLSATSCAERWEKAAETADFSQPRYGGFEFGGGRFIRA